VTTSRALALGTLTVGGLDLADAIVFFGVRSGVSPVRILQGIAAGLLGRDAFTGGLATALAGLLLHFTIAFAIVAVFVAASRTWPALTRSPFRSGCLYGLVVYGVMNYVVIPLSAATSGPFRWPVLINGLLIHLFGVGLPAALFARAIDTPTTIGASR
jgi:hypothetical protein